MLMQEPTPQMIEQWKQTYAHYRKALHPNRKSAEDIIAYLKNKYPVTKIKDKKWNSIVIDNVLNNEYFKDQIPKGALPKAEVYLIDDSAGGKLLYDNQDDIFDGLDIVFGIELETGFFYLQGSSLLWDEMFAIKGLSETDLDNYFLVAEYINCLKKFDMLKSILN